jgi:hypothetical protein
MPLAALLRQVAAGSGGSLHGGKNVVGNNSFSLLVHAFRIEVRAGDDSGKVEFRDGDYFVATAASPQLRTNLLDIFHRHQ